ncbi:unnamed protein product [Discosporangium mesarthrocarpum]
MVAPPSTRVIHDEAREKFLGWARSEQKIEIYPDIDLFHQFKEGYRGVMASRDIPAGVTLLRVDRQCCIGPQTTDATKEEWREALTSSQMLGVTASNTGQPRLTKACITVLRILHELGLGEGSPFHPYLNILPRGHRIPIEWNAAEQALLKGTAVEPLLGMGSLERQFQVFENMFSLHPNMWAPEARTKEAFAGAVNWVRSILCFRGSCLGACSLLRKNLLVGGGVGFRFEVRLFGKNEQIRSTTNRTELEQIKNKLKVIDNN